LATKKALIFHSNRSIKSWPEVANKSDLSSMLPLRNAFRTLDWEKVAFLLETLKSDCPQILKI